MEVNFEKQEAVLSESDLIALKKMAKGVAEAVEPMLVEMAKNGCTLAIGRITFDTPTLPFAIAIGLGQEEVKRLAVAVDGDEVVKAKTRIDPPHPESN